MRIDHPSPRQLPQQRALWQQAFGDTDDFLDSFFRTAYSPDRCRCIFIDDEIAAILYWIDCALEAQKLAYIYAVVTHPSHRGKGLCQKLMADTHDLLRARGYAGAVLVPQQESLRKMYAGMGYENCGGLETVSCSAADAPAALRTIGPAEFAKLRRKLLPGGSVVQEGKGLAFLAEQLQFYAGDGFLLAAYTEKDILHGMELLGSTADAPGIVAALGCREGQFRVPGVVPFAMFYPLIPSAKVPHYFGFAFD